VSPYLIEEALFSQPETGNNYQVYAGGGRLRIDAEWAGPGDQEAVAGRVLGRLPPGLRAEIHWVEHIPRTGGKTRRVRPLADRDEVMRSPSLLRRGT
jgi:hypothetical protein